MTNNEKFNKMINNCRHPRRVMNALRILAIKPSVHESEDMGKEIQIGVGELLAGADVAQFDQKCG